MILTLIYSENDVKSVTLKTLVSLICFCIHLFSENLDIAEFALETPGHVSEIFNKDQ